MRTLRMILALVSWSLTAAAEPFTIVSYNVENLFDADGVAVYDDYQPAGYTPAHVATKIENVATILAKFSGGKGPDVILFQEIEIDQTPGRAMPDYAAILRRLAGRSARAWLSDPQITAEIKDIPSEGWLLKALADANLVGYTVITGRDEDNAPTAAGARAIKCVTFTRLPVKRIARYPTESARNILETELTVDGYSLHVFNLHWKSGASGADTEVTRVQNARVLRARLDELLASDPNTDIVIGGDFNSHYNQRQRYPQMIETAINDVLGSQGNELVIRGERRDLYNLWFELPPEQRGSDTYRGEWGTLVQLILSRGLYDQNGVQYQDNSFGVARLPGLNIDGAGVPIRWSPDGPSGSGFSDHLPVYAHFRTVTDRRKDRWMELIRPSEIESDGAIRPVDYGAIDLSLALESASLPPGVDLRDGSWSGKLFHVVGESVPDRYPRVTFAGAEFDIYGEDKAVRALLYAQRDAGGPFDFYGELGTYKGRWQFVVRDPKWVKPVTK